SRSCVSSSCSPLSSFFSVIFSSSLAHRYLHSFPTRRSSDLLGHHPDRTLVPGVEIASGSLGHGLPLALGTALGLRAQNIRRPDGTEPRVVVLIGDGDVDEGSNREAIAGAGRYGLNSPTTVLVEQAA